MLTIIRDTQEKKGLDFEFYDGIDLIKKKLPEGDYALAGNKEVIIERKATTGELYLNLANSYEKARFYRECVRLQAYTRPIILCEFPESRLYDFPKFSGIPNSRHSRLKMNPKFFRQLIYELPEKYPPLKLVFCNDRIEAQDFIIRTFKECQDGPTKKLNF